MNDLMSESDLEKVTGYKAQAKQCKLLTEHGIFFVKDANGAPHVTWYSFNNPTHLRFNQALAHMMNLTLQQWINYGSQKAY
tara:strand:+ start:43 stop:285 length:243 start_codon:yes stop_codon:yes gene_type:complete